MSAATNAGTRAAIAALDNSEQAYVLGWLRSAIEHGGAATQDDLDKALAGVEAERQRRLLNAGR